MNLSQVDRMFGVMGYGEWTTDQLEQELAADEAERSRLAARDLAILEELDSRQVATGDGCRSLSEWTASRLDVSLETAKSLVRTMRRTIDRPDLREGLASGAVSFDRVEALSRIPDEVGLCEHIDISGVRREAALRARINADTDHRTAADQYLVLQPSLDESWWRLWGGLDGYSGAIVDKALTEAADQLPEFPDGTRGTSSWRKATALVELCISDEPLPAQVTVFIDAQHAAGTDGEAGVVLEAGPRIGKDTLQAILCDGITEITVNGEDGVPMSYGRQKRTITPAPTPSHPPPRPRPMRRRRLQQQKPAPNPPHHPLVGRRANRTRQPDHPLLVPPPHRHPPVALHPPTPPRTRTHPLQETSTSTTRGLMDYSYGMSGPSSPRANSRPSACRTLPNRSW